MSRDWHPGTVMVLLFAIVVFGLTLATIPLAGVVFA